MTYMLRQKSPLNERLRPLPFARRQKCPFYSLRALPASALPVRGSLAAHSLIRSFLPALVLLAATALKAQGSEFRWKAVDGAASYQVEVREGRKTIFSEKTTRPAVRLNLPEGEYEVRVVLINKFGKEYFRSDWQDLKVQNKVEPSISSLSRRTIYKPEDGRKAQERINLYGKNLFRMTRVRLRGPDGREHQPAVDFVREGTLSLLINTGALTLGSYDVIVENPGNQRDEKTAALDVETGEPKTKPEETAGALPALAEENPDILRQSLFIPGSGQLIAGETGSAAGIYTAMGLGTLIFFQQRSFYAANSDRYLRSRNFGWFLPGSSDLTPFAYMNYRRSSALEKELRTNARLANDALGLIGAAYLYNVLDAYALAYGRERSGSEALWRSALLPGLGQLSRRQRLKGFGLMTGFLAGVAYMHNARADFNRLLFQEQRFAEASLVLPAEDRYRDFSAYAYYNRSLLGRKIQARRVEMGYTGLAVSGLYGYNLFDAFLGKEYASAKDRDSGESVAASFYLLPVGAQDFAMGATFTF